MDSAATTHKADNTIFITLKKTNTDCVFALRPRFASNNTGVYSECGSTSGFLANHHRCDSPTINHLVDTIQLDWLPVMFNSFGEEPIEILLRNYFEFCHIILWQGRGGG
jgi:hypothetical protein